MTSSRLRLATRGSALALTQARFVEGCLRALLPDIQVEILTIKTTGDRLLETPLAKIAGKGVFIKEIEDCLLAGSADLAVHSLKDLPTELPDRLMLGAIPEREDPRDCLVSKSGQGLLALPAKSVVGTSSLRRQAQIFSLRPELRARDLRGNLDTRLRKVANGEVDCIVVAYAGVKRLERVSEVTEILPLDQLLPAPGQGFLGIEIREGNVRVAEIVSRLNHEPSARAATAERALLAALGGGCRVPIAAHAREEAGSLVLDGLVISPDGQKKVRATLSGSPTKPAAIGDELGHQLLSQGAREILAALPENSGSGSGS